jgi:hypothetical protein
MMRPQRLRQRAVAWLFAGAVVGHAAVAAAQRATPAVRLDYQRNGVTACPNENALRTMVAARLGYDPFREDAANVVAVAIARAHPGLRASITVRDAAGNVVGLRHMASSRADCAELSSAISLAVSIIVEPASAPFLRDPPPTVGETVEPGETVAMGEARETGETRETRETRETGQTRATRTPARLAIPTPPRPESYALRAGLGAVAVGLAAPSVTVGVSPQVALRLRWFSVGLEGRFDLPVAGTTESGARFETQLLLAVLAPCAHYASVFACALVAGGAMRATVPDTSATGHFIGHAAAGVRLGFEHHLASWLVLRVHGDLWTPLVPTALYLDNTQIWSTPPLSFTAGLALLWEFRR